MMIETGLLHGTFQQDFKVYGCLATDSWIKKFWKFVYEHDIRLVVPKEIMPMEIREGDRAIIHECVRMGYIETNLVRLNRVRNFCKLCM